MDRNEAKSILEACQHELSNQTGSEWCRKKYEAIQEAIKALEQPEIIHCDECKHNPKLEWFGCPASHLSEKQKPDNAWCWRGERRTDNSKECAEERTETHALDTIYKQVAIDAVLSVIPYDKYWVEQVKKAIWSLPPAESEQEWIPCDKQLPKIGQSVLLSTTRERTLSGYLEKPTTMYLVFDDNKNKEIWVYDPESYTYAFDYLPKAEDCSFSDSSSGNGFLSVTSMNYDTKFEGITAWMPHPRPYQGWKISEKENRKK